MSEMKTIMFPGDKEPREIVDAKARERLDSVEKDYLKSIDPNDLGLEQDTRTGLVYTTYKGARSAKGVKITIDSIDITDDVKTAVDSYLDENPPAVKFTINGMEADENGNFNLEDLPGAGGNSVVDF